MATIIAPEAPNDTVDDRVARGKAARAASPRAGLGALDSSSARDPLGILEAEAEQRVADLVPLRYGRMLVSAFTFYRAGAGIMSADLAGLPQTGLQVQLCGDAHLSNFGGFASPERALVFDLNDFDETLPGPFEWDVKRLVASFEIAGRHRGFAEKERRAAVTAVAGSYRAAMRQFAELGNLDVWYARLDMEGMLADLRARQAKAVKQTAAKARTKDSLKALAKLTHVVDGEPRILSDPPLIVPIHELADTATTREAIHAELRGLFASYVETLQRDRAHLLAGYRLVDLARKVVGVGSVGTRAWIALLLGKDDADPLFLQIKEASPSALEAHLGESSFENHGRRVVEGQRLMQAASDIFLGWVHIDSGLDGLARDFYVRQLWDWKTSADLETILPDGLLAYAKVCGWTLARAHARSGDRVAIATYLGKSDAFDLAMARFAAAYADLNERDYQMFVAAVRSGRFEAKEGL